MEAIRNGLFRVEKYMKNVKSEKRVRFLWKSEKLAFSIIRFRLNNNINNCIETGVLFNSEEAKTLNLPIKIGEKSGIYYLDINVFSKKPQIIYFA